MALDKKVLVLRPVDSSNQFDINVSGIARVEKDDASASFHLSVVNAHATGGEYICALLDSNKRPCFFSLGKRPNVLSQQLPFSFDLRRGFAVGVARVLDFIPITVAFSSAKELDLSLNDLRKTFADYCIEKRESVVINQDLVGEVLTDYNDELVATENYYEKEASGVSSKDDEFIASRQEKEKESEADDNCSNDETNSFSSEKYGDKNPYHLAVRKELDSLFSSFPEEESLKGFFPSGKFVRISYSEKKYYVVGIISENGQPKHICYGVPSSFSPHPPSELKEHATFIPLSLFNVSGDGFWMIFQSAISGKCEKLEDVKP